MQKAGVIKSPFYFIGIRKKNVWKYFYL